MFKIIDNFYKNPDQIRDFALNCKYKKPVSTKWKGLRSVEKHPETKPTLYQIAKYLQLEGKPDWNQIEISDNFWQRASVGLFTTLYDGQEDNIHFHYFTGRWSGVCYLSPPELCKGKIALSFYRHLTRNIETAQYLDKNELQEIKKETADPNLWMTTHEIDMKYNRMVVFDGQYFHKACNGFGSSPDNCRLTQLFGFNM
ncbi:hypothetical protein [Membranihabitans marinus]|uniref:hypothetical protein n=1 Tax=Membranihabitans marinus TaxID=1227546 RepID=UPI001F46B6AA|nr:hypothetical protein [Membranihabitans marinus]